MDVREDVELEFGILVGEAAHCRVVLRPATLKDTYRAAALVAGKKGETIGGLIYDWTHGDRSANGPVAAAGSQVVKVEVVKNGNIVASVNEENSGRR